MNEISEEDATRALLLLEQIGNSTRNGAAEPSSPEVNPLSSDEEDDADDHPVISALLSAGVQGIFIKNTNFTESQLYDIYESVRQKVETALDSGRGSRHNMKPIDLFFTMLTCINRGGTWDDLSFAFRCKKTTFETNMNMMLELTAKKIYKTFVEDRRDEWTMNYIHEQKLEFKEFPCSYYAMDVRSQQTLRPTGTHAEVKPFFSGKQKLYGVKTEASVLPNGLCVMLSSFYSGQTADITIFRRNLAFHNEMLKKQPDELDIPDEGPLEDKYLEHWGVLMDKGYIGTQDMIRSIHPKKNPRSGRLGVNEILQNRKISSDRIVVERFFGRQTSLWAVMERQFKWSLEKYNTLSQLCVGLTNAHIIFNPLSLGDEVAHQRYRDLLYEKGVFIAEKRKSSQEAYRERRRLRLSGEWDALRVADNNDANEN